MAIQKTINKASVQQIVITVNYENGIDVAPSGAILSARALHLDGSETITDTSKSWNYASLPQSFKDDIKGLFDAISNNMSQDIGETGDIL